ETDASHQPQTPSELTEPMDAHRVCMRGTWQQNPHCTALAGEIGISVGCTIYEQRPSPCRALQAAWQDGVPSPQCDRARIAHGLPALTVDDWIAYPGGVDLPMPIQLVVQETLDPLQPVLVP